MQELTRHLDTLNLTNKKSKHHTKDTRKPKDRETGPFSMSERGHPIEMTIKDLILDAIAKAFVTIKDNIQPQIDALTDENNAAYKLDSSIINTFTPGAGTNYPNWGGCYYYKVGHRVHVHLGISGLTANTYYSGITTLGAGYRPLNEMSVSGSAGTSATRCYVFINSSGSIAIFTTGTYAQADLDFDAFN